LKTKSFKKKLEACKPKSLNPSKSAFFHSFSFAQEPHVFLLFLNSAHAQDVFKQTQILRGQQRGNGSAKMISMAMQFIIINLKKNIESIHF
jgi:hypothetical protein